MQGYLYVLFISILVSLLYLHWFLYSHLLITMEIELCRLASRYFSLVNGFLCSYNWFNHSAFLCTLFNGRSLISKILCTFTFTTGVSSVAWLSDDLRLMLICWGATLIGLVLLIGLNKGWKVVSEATKISGYLFTISWIALLSAIIWLFK